MFVLVVPPVVMETVHYTQLNGFIYPCNYHFKERKAC